MALAGYPPAAEAGMTLLVRLPCALPLSDPHRRSQIQELATAEFATVHFSESVPQPAN
jgi:hypothetical protein